MKIDIKSKYDNNYVHFIDIKQFMKYSIKSSYYQKKYFEISFYVLN